MHQGWYMGHGIDLTILGRVLLAAVLQQVYGNVLKWQVLPMERDPGPVRSAAAKIGIQFEHRTSVSYNLAMKLGSLKSVHSRDGELIVVSKDNQRAIRANHIAPSLREAIEHWSDKKGPLEALYKQLNDGQAKGAFA